MNTESMNTPLLEVHDLQVRFDTPDGEVQAVRGIDFSLTAGDALAIVGESGSGKTQAMLGMLGLLAGNGRATGRALYRGQDLMAMGETELNRHRGRDIAMIFQDPMTSLNPYLSIDKQMTEVMMHHQGLGRAEALAHAVEMLRAVRIPSGSLGLRARAAARKRRREQERANEHDGARRLAPRVGSKTSEVLSPVVRELSWTHHLVVFVQQGADLSCGRCHGRADDPPRPGGLAAREETRPGARRGVTARDG